jgi:hypothetical protein
MKTLLMLTLVLLLAVAVAIVSAAPLMTATYTETEQYTTTETYYVTEARTEEVPLTYEIFDTQMYGYYWRPSSECTVIVKNTDTESGYFRVQFHMKTRGTPTIPSTWVTKAAWQFIEAGKGNEITVRHDGAYIESFSYSVTPPVKQVTTYEQVPKTREVFQYREVERTKKVTILQYLID